MISTGASRFRFALPFTCTVLLVAIACGNSATPGFGDPDNATPTGTAPGGEPQSFGAGDATIATDASKGCVGLECKISKCDGGSPTRLRGKVFDPAGRNPLYNVAVYIPNSAPKPVTVGATCDKCSAVAVNPIPNAVITNEKGEFVIDGVPDGVGLPLVLQVGKWRRQLSVDIKPCEDNTFDDPQMMRLPAKKSEGDMPRIALQTGSADPFACLLLRMGIDASEFTGPNEDGRVHIFQGGGGELAPSGNAAPAATELWDSVDHLKKYDAVFLSCEGGEEAENKPPAAREAMQQYLNLGGRMFSTHYQYVWLKSGPPEFNQLADWGSQPKARPEKFLIDQSFPKGRALAEWLNDRGVTPKKGTLPIDDSNAIVKNEVRSVRPGAQRWIYDEANDSPKYFSFNTPVTAKPEDQCGRGVFTDLHLGLRSRRGDWKSTESATAVCNNTPLASQELALEFLLFDLTSCVQREDLPPAVPR